MAAGRYTPTAPWPVYADSATVRTGPALAGSCRLQEALAEARALGLKVVPWTVNHPAEMRRLIEMGVDGLITDYPHGLQAPATNPSRSVASPMRPHRHKVTVRS